jgi:hypothetical protein
MIASSYNDFRLVKMWPHKKNNEYRNFIETLVKSLLFSKFNKDVDPESLFGSNPILRKEKNNYKEEV